MSVTGSNSLPTQDDLAEEVLGGCEETTTGVIRLKAMEREGVLKFPMLAVNDARCKHLFDNRYGTGQSVWDSIMRYTLENGRTVNVIGEGKLANIAAADGHPAEIMDMSFAVQAMSAMYIKDNYSTLENKVIGVSDEIDDIIARKWLEEWR